MCGTCRWNNPSAGYPGPTTNCTAVQGSMPGAANGIVYEWANTMRSYRSACPARALTGWGGTPALCPGLGGAVQTATVASTGGSTILLMLDCRGHLVRMGVGSISNVLASVNCCLSKRGLMTNTVIPAFFMVCIRASTSATLAADSALS